MLRRRSGDHRGGRGRFGASFVLLVIACALMYPLIDVVIGSFRVGGSGPLTLLYWREVFRQVPVVPELEVSALLSIASVLGVLLVAVPGGYAFAKLPFRGARLAFLICVGCMMIPLESIIVPEYTNLAAIGLVGTVQGTVLVAVAVGTPLAVFLMTSYFRSLPDSLMEAAWVDGAGELRIFLGIMLPLAAPALATVAVLEFLSVWNDLLIALLFLPMDTRSIAVGLAALQGNHVLNTNVLVAGSVLSAIPPILVYLMFQRYIVSGLTMGVTQ